MKSDKPDVAEPTPPSTGPEKQRWMVVRKRETEPPEVTVFDRYDLAAMFWDNAQTQWSEVWFCRVAYGPSGNSMAGERPVVPPVSGEGTGTLTRKVTRLITETANGVGISRSIVGVWDVTSMTSERLAELRQRHEREFVYARDFDALAAEVLAKDAQLAEYRRLYKNLMAVRMTQPESTLADLRRQGEWQPTECCGRLIQPTDRYCPKCGYECRVINEQSMTPIQIAKIVHEANRAYCETIGDHSQVSFEAAPEWQRESAVNGVEGILNGTITKPEQSHESWLAEKERTGWKFGPVKDAEKKEHPCFVPYAELPPEQQHKDAIFFAIVRACAS